MNENDLVRLRHMLDAAREAVDFAQNRNSDDLDKNRMFQLAEIRLLEIIGEAARDITLEVREQYP
jgi:uncharacterized protein with HEPN domain